jgi:L-asparaginase/Glu-tRNA(Gln) amidotransferase subunit D
MHAARFKFRVFGISRELEYLESDAAQRAAYRAVTQRVRRDPGFWVHSSLIPLLAPVIGLLTVRPGAAALHATTGISARECEGIVIVALGAGLCAASTLLVRRKYQRAVRAYLNEIGVPVCNRCGYNLFGTIEPRCSECGHTRVRATRKPD